MWSGFMAMASRLIVVGLMFWADQIGLDSILAAVEKYHGDVGGAQWEPAPLLKQLVADGKTFGDL